MAQCLKDNQGYVKDTHPNYCFRAMPIPIATNFLNNSNLPLDAHTVYDNMGDLLASEWRKEGVPVYVKDEKRNYFWDGTRYTEEAGLTMVMAEFDPETLTYAPEAQVLDKNGIPTNQTITIDEWYDNREQGIISLTKTGWQRLNELTHEESLALVAEYAAEDLPITRLLTFWEYRKLYPNEMTREEYGAGRIWRFEYNGTNWNPVEDVDHTGEEP